MLYKFSNKKGNITLILVGLIFVMMIMTMFLSRRLTSHTQLLTLGDYTQISRYYLESYANHVMQQVRAQVNDPTSKLNEAMCQDIETLPSRDLTDCFVYIESDALQELETVYGSNNKIKRLVGPGNFSIKLTNNTEAIGYPEWLTIEKEKTLENLKKEKEGVLEVTCACSFNKRKYTLVVQFPFTVVYRMTPVLKDFMLFADNIYSEQRWEKQVKLNDDKSLDRLNIVAIENGRAVLEDYAESLKEDNDINFNYINRGKFRIRPWFLLQPPEGAEVDEKNSGMVYFGPTDRTFEKSIFYNLGGIAPKSDPDSSDTDLIDHSDVNIVTPESVGLPQNFDITNETAQFPIGGGIKSYGKEGNLNDKGHQWKVGVLGFCKEFTTFFDVGTYNLSEFFNDDIDVLMKHDSETFWGEIIKKSLDYRKYYGFSFGLKLFGVHYKTILGNPVPPIKRQIFGNVFGRFIVFNMWNAGSGSGEALRYNPDCTIEQVEPQRLSFDPTREPIPFKPQEYEEGMSEQEQRELYNKYMSKTMSGMVAKDHYKKNGDGRNQALFMPINYDYDGGWEHKIFDDSDFEANDGFKFKGRDKGFDKFGELWFARKDDNPSDPTDDRSCIEKRIGRTFEDEDRFKEAVGYPERFKINGVVYVKGDLDLSKGMNLKADDCSGGIVLVDGDIKVGNILRGQDPIFDRNNKFELYTGSGNGVEIYKGWVDSTSDYYIGADKILTFVCLPNGGKKRKIEIVGNTLLGVQLINLTQDDSKKRASWDREDIEDQIVWNLPVDSKKKDIIFYGSIACNQLNLPQRLLEFGEITNSCDAVLNAPVFLYPSVMASETPPLAVQIMEDMRCYRLTAEKEGATD